MTRGAGGAALIACLSLTANTLARPASQEPPPESREAPRINGRDLDSVGIDAGRRARIDEALRTGAYDHAQALLLEEVERNPRSPELLRVLGGVLFVTGEYLSSAIALKKAEALAPLDARSRFTLAMSYVVMRQRRWARLELGRLADDEPRNALYPYWLARLDYDEEHYAAAVEGFRRVLALDPGYLKAHDNLGLAYEALGRYDEAMESYQKAVRLNRERKARSPWPALNLGILLTRLDRFDDAEPLLRESAVQDPRFAQARYQLGRLLEMKARPADAIAELTAAVDLDPTYAEPHYALARLYRRAGETEKADGALARFQALRKEKGR